MAPREPVKSDLGFESDQDVYPVINDKATSHQDSPSNTKLITQLSTSLQKKKKTTTTNNINSNS